MEVNKKFSIKKLLLTNLKIIMVLMFIETTLLFLNSSQSRIELDKFVSSNLNSSYLIEKGKKVENEINTLEEGKFEEIKEPLFYQDQKHLTQIYNEAKEKYGEDYPAEGIYLYAESLYENYFSNTLNVSYPTFIFIGMLIGTTVYIVGIQNAKGKKLAIELIIAITSIFIIGILINTIYGSTVYYSINKALPNDLAQLPKLINLNQHLMHVPFIIAIIYIANLMHKTIIASKLNKELNKKSDG